MIQVLNKSITYTVLPIAGFSVLPTYLLLWRHFSFSWIGVLAYVVTSFGLSYLVAALKVAERFPSLDRYHFVAVKDLHQSASVEDWGVKQATFLASGFRRGRILLTPSEDALICVPILLLGVNPVTALAGGALFGVLHLGRFTYLECIAKAGIYALACYFILPDGLLTIVAGHFIVDALALLLLNLIRRVLERRLGSRQASVSSTRP